MFKALFMSALFALPTLSFAATHSFKGYTFEAYATSDNGKRYTEIKKSSGTYLQVGKNEEYSIVVRNPLPVRVAVAVTIDGLNVIDGKRTTPDKAEKWMIDANSSITLRGWQTDRSSLRRFVFTDQGGSFAEWKGDRDNKKYTQNLGVIGAAFFWNSAELEEALRPPPQPFESPKRELHDKKKMPASTPAPAKSSAAQAEERAGTGMGSREKNSVVDVEFHYNAGMYRGEDVLVLYYEFTKEPPRPLPFEDDTDKRNFTPEMP